MPDLTLGSTPPRLTVWLVADAPLSATVTADEAWPAPPELVFDTGAVWPATLSDDSLTAGWALSAAQVGALVDLGPRRATLRDPGSHVVYAHGTVYATRVVESGDPSLVVGPAGALTVDTAVIPSITYVVGEGGGTGGVTDHGALTGLADDDHPQYLTEGRGDARYDAAGTAAGLVGALDIPTVPGDIGAQPAGDYATATHAHDGTYQPTGDYVTEGDPRLTDARTPTTHAHPIADVTGLQTALDGKQAAGSYAAATHTHDDRYYTETESDGRFVRTVNGTGPDGSGNVVVAGGGGGGTAPTLIVAPALVTLAPDPGNTRTAILPTGVPVQTTHYVDGGGRIAGGPLSLSAAVTVTDLAVSVTTGAAAATLRFGLYADAGGRPGALIFDSGTIDASAAGMKSVSTARTLAAGSYWFLVAQGSNGDLRFATWRHFAPGETTPGSWYLGSHSPANPLPSNLSATTLVRQSPAGSGSGCPVLYATVTGVGA